MKSWPGLVEAANASGVVLYFRASRFSSISPALVSLSTLLVMGGQALAAAPVSAEEEPSASAAGKTEEAAQEGSEPDVSLIEADESDGTAKLVPVDLSASTRHKMSNDLEIVMQAIPGAPQVSVCTSFDAGSRLDPIESPGAYRVLAEMLKEGGYRSAGRDYAALVARRGGVNSLTVSHYSTTFCTTVPAAEVSLALWVSAGRFTPGALTENLLRTAVDNLAKESASADAQVRLGRANERLRRMAFLGTEPYARPILPNADELDTLTLETIRRLHREGYVARRATVAMSGGFEDAAVTPQFSQHLFAARPGKKLRYQVASLVKQSTGRFSMAEDRSAKTPAAWYGWVVPAGEDRLATEVALSALVSPRRLGGSLIGKSRAAKTVELYLDEDAAPGGPAFPRMEIVGSNSRSLGTIEKGFGKQLRMLANKGPSKKEVIEIQRKLREARAEGLNTSEQRAFALARGVRLGQSPEQILAPLKEGVEISYLEPEQVRQAALHLLAPHRRSSIEIYPKGWQDPWQKAMHTYHIVSKGQTLGSIARARNTSVAVIRKINGLKRGKIIYPGDKLRVPRSRAKKAEKKPRFHRVRRGDTLGALALKYGVSSGSISSANGMGSKSTIRTGENLQIPWGSGSSSKKSGKKGAKDSASKGAAPTSSRRHTVKGGETLSGIAKKHGVSTVALARANGISHKAGVRIGQKLKLPAPGTGKSSKKKKIAPLKVYKVKKGDTLSGIAKKHGVSVASLTVENGISRKSMLRLGQSLKIPAKK